MKFAKSVGDAAGVVALAFVGIATAVKECTEALEKFASATKKPE